MYDKRYSNEAIKRIRNQAFITMFICMLLLAIGVGKVAYATGYNDGYYSRTMSPANVKTSNVQQPHSSLGSPFEMSNE